MAVSLGNPPAMEEMCVALKLGFGFKEDFLSMVSSQCPQPMTASLRAVKKILLYIDIKYANIYFHHMYKIFTKFKKYSPEQRRKLMKRMAYCV